MHDMQSIVTYECGGSLSVTDALNDLHSVQRVWGSFGTAFAKWLWRIVVLVLDIFLIMVLLENLIRIFFTCDVINVES